MRQVLLACLILPVALGGCAIYEVRPAVMYDAPPPQRTVVYDVAPAPPPPPTSTVTYYRSAYIEPAPVAYYPAPVVRARRWHRTTVVRYY